MKRAKTKVKTIVNVLDNPDPRFVSVVDHGANQRSFHTVKRDRNPQEASMPDTAIHKLVFAVEHFADEAAVEKFLKSKNYSDYTITKNGDTFEVIDTAKEDFGDAELRTVPHHSVKGLTYIAGEIATKSDDDGAEGDDAKKADDAAAKGEGTDEGAGDDAKKEDATDDDAAKGDEAGSKKEAPAGEDGANTDEGKAAKADGASAGEAQKQAKPRVRTRRGLTVAGKSLAQVVSGHEDLSEELVEADTAKAFADMLANYNGSMPPGVYDMADAMMGELRKMFHKSEISEAAVNKLASDFTDGVIALHGVYEQIMANAEKSAETKSVEVSEDEVLTALLSLMFEPSEKAQENAEDVATLSDAMATIKQLTADVAKERDRADSLSLDLAEAEKALKAGNGVRTIGTRKSTDEDEGAAVVKEVEQKEAEEAASRTMKRLFGAHAAKAL